MPDCHAFCTDLEQAKKEFLIRFKLCIQILEEIGLSQEDYEVALRFTEDFYERNDQFIGSLVEVLGRPVLCEMWKERFFYFIMKWDFNFIDSQDKAAALSTDQIDVENAKRYDITYVNEKGDKNYPLIMHCSPSGAIERCVYALLEKAYKKQKNGEPPMLPLWLSPTQVRIIPLSNKHIGHAEKLADTLKAQNIRVDIDDRPLTLQKRVRESEMEWVPYTIVIGRKEIESGILPVRDRKTGKIRKMKQEKLIREVEEILKGKPFKPLPLQTHLSKRPQFYG